MQHILNAQKFQNSNDAVVLLSVGWLEGCLLDWYFTGGKICCRAL
jgi:hypothetical protein